MKKRGDHVFLKRHSDSNVIENVRYVNGIVSFGQVKLNVYCYEIDGVLIDTGSQSLLRHFKHFFQTMDVDQVLITHDHEDHTGGASYIEQKLGLPIYIHQMSEDETRKKANYPFYRKVFWGKRRPFQSKALANTFQSRQANWDVIETPGHTADHLSFLNKETGQLFSGDIYVHPKTKVVLRQENMPELIRSLKHVLSYDFDTMFCSHAGYVKDGKKALQTKVDYLENMQGEILYLHEKGKSLKEIEALIFKKKYPITLLSFGEWDTKHFIRSFIDNSST